MDTSAPAEYARLRLPRGRESAHPSAMDVEATCGTATATNWYAVELHAARARYLRDWAVVKRARFNAAKRFERKHEASTLAFALAGVVGIALPFFTQLFSNELGAHSRNVFEFYGYLTGALALGLGLVEQAKGYESRSRRFDECGRRVNGALRRLRNNPAADEHVLEDFVAEYQRALDICDVNHDGIDHEIAIAEEEREAARATPRTPAGERQRALAERRLSLLKWKESVGIYWLYWVVMILPVVIAIAARLMLAGPSA